MHFDDRLATVLRVRAEGSAVSRIQYRQLLDLLGTSPSEARTTNIDSAYAQLSELSARISADDRAAILLEAGMRLRSPRLVSALAIDAPQVALAAVQRASLDEAQWLDLLPALPVAARGLVRHRRDLGPAVERQLERLGIHDRGLPAAATSTEAEPASDAGIGAIVRRIEAFRRARQDNDNALDGEAPRLPLGEDHVLRVPIGLRAFDFATDGSGRVVWADPGAAPSAFGLQLLGSERFGGAAAFKRRQPIRGAALTLAGGPAIAGEWQLDATPRFDALGNFTGYAGRLRRPATATTAATSPAADSESDRIRQVLHELRTPVNAIQGFAEIIQQQLFGPTPHEYRALAASIASDGARVLAAFDELERLAKLDSGALKIEAGSSDFAAVLAATVAQLGHHTGPRGSGFAVRIDADVPLLKIATAEAESIAWRLLATLAGATGPGEMLKLRLRQRNRAAELTVELPATLAAREDAALFRAAVGAVPQAIAAGMFGVGFALRLARAEARAAGGSLERRKGKLRLILPGLTNPAAPHSQGPASDEAAPQTG